MGRYPVVFENKVFIMENVESQEAANLKFEEEKAVYLKQAGIEEVLKPKKKKDE